MFSNSCFCSDSTSLFHRVEYTTFNFWHFCLKYFGISIWKICKSFSFFFKLKRNQRSEISYDSKVIPKVSGTILTLSAPGMISFSIDLSRIQGKGFRIAVWGQPVSACDCGEEAARWLSRFLLQEDTGFRLVYYPLDYPTREIRKSNKQWLLTPDDTVSFIELQLIK